MLSGPPWTIGPNAHLLLRQTMSVLLCLLFQDRNLEAGSEDQSESNRSKVRMMGLKQDMLSCCPQPQTLLRL